jgi:HSP20 family protein
MSKEVEVRRAERPARLWDWFDTPDFGRWFGLRPFFGFEDRLRIEEELTDDTMVVRAEMPGIDPDKDVEITVDEGMLHIKAERRSETKEEKEGRVRSEFHYGSYERTMRVPSETNVDDVTASYKDGILEVRVPYKVPTEAPPRKVAISRT